MKARINKPLFRVLLCLLLSTTSILVFAQTTWRRAYGGFGIDEGHCIRQTADGGYILAGSTGSFGGGSGDIYVLRLDAFGEPIWSRTYGGIGVENGVACRELTDGFIIAGTTSQGANGSYDMLLIRTDGQGVPLWERSYGTADWDLCNAMEVLPDGFLLGGITYGGNHLNGGAYVVRTNTIGDTLWTRTLGGSDMNECNGLALTSDQGFLVAGSKGTASGYADGFLTKLDQVGVQEWTVSLGGDSADVLRSVVQADDGSIVACGMSRSQSNVAQIYIVSVDGTGGFLWNQYIGNTADAGGSEIRRSNTGGYVFTGYNTLNFGSRDMILTTVDAIGYFQFGNNYGDGHPADGISIDPTSDGGYVIAGWIEQAGPGQRAIYVVKTDSSGQTANLNVVDYFDPLPVSELTKPTGEIISPTLLSVGEEMNIHTQGRGSALARITDMQGETQDRIQIEAGTRISIRVPELAPGPYLISIEQKGQEPVVAKFVVMQ
jgi:hypothetical protein